MSYMRTIDNILGYTLTDEQMELVRKAWLYNGVWGDWENIEKVIYENAKLLPWFDDKKAKNLLIDLRKLAFRHDIEYSLKLWFYLANIRFAIWVYYLTHWSNYKRFALAIITLIILNRHGKKFYKK